MGRFLILILLSGVLQACKTDDRQPVKDTEAVKIAGFDAQGFEVMSTEDSEIIIRVLSPWPNAEKVYRYLLLPSTLPDQTDRNFDAVIQTPVKRIVVTSTTHVAALEALGVEERLVGFPGTTYISSEKTRMRINTGDIVELGANELVNTERLLELSPDLVVGFSIDNQNKAYKTIINAGIPVVYNGDWTESTPLGKAEWIKFFGPFFGLEKKADSIYAAIKLNYNTAKTLASGASKRPTVVSGALYKDIWYLPGGESWAASFMEDAHADYLWADTPGTGSLSLSLESVIEKGLEADFWIAPSQYTNYNDMLKDNEHYLQFKAFRDKNIFTFAATTGATGGLLYYELGPQRPDIVLKDLISIFHPELLPDYTPFFFKPLD